MNSWMRFKIKQFVLVFVALGLFSPVAFANVAGNSSFEEQIGSGTENNWDATNGAVVGSVGGGVVPAGFTAAPDGNQVLYLDLQANFTFQIIRNVRPGDFVTFSALGESDVINGGGRLKIEFKEALPGGADQTIVEVHSEVVNNGNAPRGGGYIRFTASGIAPPKTSLIALTFDRTGDNAGDVVFDDVSAEVNPVNLLNVAVNKNRVQAGDVITFTTQFQNGLDIALNDVVFHGNIPDGFNVLQETVRLDNQRVSSTEGSLIVPIGTIGREDIRVLNFQLLVTSGVTVGKEYTLDFVMTNPNRISDKAIVAIRVDADPVFSEGTIIGKVFNDENQNGEQDKGERGVPFVRLFTEEGIKVVTDQYGRYSIPGVKAGRHIVKIDGHTLPEGTRFVTRESKLLRTTPGILSKANFAVLVPESKIPPIFQEDLAVSITQGLDTSRPQLQVTMSPNVLTAGLEGLQEEPIFGFKLNYADFIKSWRLEVRDEIGREVWTGFGVAEPPTEVIWTGETQVGFSIQPGLYSYRFIVEDRDGHEDWTPLQFFHVLEAGKNPRNLRDIEIPSVGDFNLFADGKQSIPLVAKPTIRIHGKAKPGHKVRINGRPVQAKTDGVFQAELYTTPGQKEFLVESTSPSGETVSYHETVTVKDSMFFMVGLAEEQLGINFADGNLGVAGNDRTFKDGFYADGRLSYYFVGKIKGKFLVRSHYDTDDPSSALFRNLDEDDYYPIYGDASQRDYEAEGSLQRFFFVVEMERSFIKWGSFETNFTDTELANYNRTLSGLKIHYETKATTPYGDPDRGFTLFWSETGHRGDHNEFAATGGSLYYLRNRHVVEGSEKVRVEIRDKISNIPVDSYDLLEGEDYEIDYRDGRILLSSPLSALAATDSLTSNDIIDGNPVFLIVDYEYEIELNQYENGNRGIRGFTQVGDHLKIGATLVEEKRSNADYDMRGVDATLRVGRNTKVYAEYAESKLTQVNQSVSFNGGLNFVDLSHIGGRRARQSAYMIKGETKPTDNTDISAYIQEIEPGFSNDHSRSQEGLRKYGVQAKYQLNESLLVRYRFDGSEVVSQLRPLHEQNVAAPFEERKVHTVQAKYDDGTWFGEAEYQRQNTEIPEAPLLPSEASEIDFANGFTAKVGRRMSEDFAPYVKAQITTDGDDNHQLGGGFRYQIRKNVFTYLEQMFGHYGDSTYFGFERLHGNKGTSYMNFRLADRGIGRRSLSSTVGSSYQLSKRSRIFSEREYSTYNSEESFADILGYDVTLRDRWSLTAKFERRHLDDARSEVLDAVAASSLAGSNTTNTISTSVSYKGEKLQTSSSLEVRADTDVPKLYQWITRNRASYQLNPDVGVKAKLDFGKSRFTDPGDTTAYFTEFDVGIAYRPIAHDKLNVLARYSYLNNIANDAQFEQGIYGITTDEKAHIFSIDLAYDLHRFVGIVEKLAIKRGFFDAENTDELIVNTFLWINRINVHITQKWDFAVEYRALWQGEAADTLRHGFLAEVDREFYDYVRLGLGYNFTDFDDDIRRTNDFDSHGPFVRLTAKF